MRFTQESSSAANIIRSHGDGELRVNESIYRGAVIVSAASVIAEPNVQNFEQLVAIEAPRLLALEPELILLGTGARQIFPAPSYGAQFLRLGIGFEVMDTGAACRTFNVLVGEQRRVTALLLA